VFRGRFEHFIDGKGRTSIPAKFREVLQSTYRDERLVLTNFDGCLWAYPFKEWEKVEGKVASLPQFKKEVKAIQRMFISSAIDIPLDKLGRILIPSILREYAGLKREIFFVGMTNRIEIWDKGAWQKEFNQSQENLDAVGEALAEFGI